MEEEILWAEKYRPKSLDEIVNQKEIRLEIFEFKGSHYRFCCI